MLYSVILLAVLIALSAVFSGSEIAFMSIPPSKVQELYTKRAVGAQTLKRLKRNPHRLLIAILIGNNIVNISASAYTAVMLTNVFGSNSVGITTGIMTFVILVFGEITPKSFAHAHAVGISLFMAKPFLFLEYLLFPVILFFEVIVRGVNKFFGMKKDAIVTEDELMAMVRLGAEEGAIDRQEREFIENVLEFNDITVKDVMVPRTDVQALDENATLGEAAELIENFGHSRIPIYRGDIDHIVGILNVKDVLQNVQRFKKSKKLKTLQFDQVLKTPFSKKINVLFREFQKRHIHMAVVIDEYGGTAGVVAMEDLLEEIVGEIADEFDEEEKSIDVIDKYTIIACGDVWVEEISDIFNVKIAGKARDTLNAMILKTLGRFPSENEVVRLAKITVKILEVGNNVIKKVRIRKRRFLRG